MSIPVRASASLPISPPLWASSHWVSVKMLLYVVVTYKSEYAVAICFSSVSFIYSFPVKGASNLNDENRKHEFVGLVLCRAVAALCIYVRRRVPLRVLICGFLRGFYAEAVRPIRTINALPSVTQR